MLLEFNVVYIWFVSNVKNFISVFDEGRKEVD